MKRGDIYRAPWPDGGRHLVCVVSVGGRFGVLVKWLSGPLAGREARLDRATLRRAPAIFR